MYFLTDSGQIPKITTLHKILWQKNCVPKIGCHKNSCKFWCNKFSCNNQLKVIYSNCKLSNSYSVGIKLDIQASGHVKLQQNKVKQPNSKISTITWSLTWPLYSMCQRPKFCIDYLSKSKSTLQIIYKWSWTYSLSLSRQLGQVHQVISEILKRIQQVCSVTGFLQLLQPLLNLENQ